MASRFEKVAGVQVLVIYCDIQGCPNRAAYSVVCNHEMGQRRVTRTLGIYVCEAPEHIRAGLEIANHDARQYPLAPGEKVSNVRIEPLAPASPPVEPD